MIAAGTLGRQEPPGSIKTYDEVGLAMEDLNVGRIAAVVCDDPVAANYALDKYKETLKIATVIETGEERGEFRGGTSPSRIQLLATIGFPLLCNKTD